MGIVFDAFGNATTAKAQALIKLLGEIEIQGNGNGSLRRFKLAGAGALGTIVVLAFGCLAIYLVGHHTINHPDPEDLTAAQIDRAITNNLRHLSASADQYYLESGKTEAKFDDLFSPDKKHALPRPIAGENYRTVVFKQDEPLVVKRPNGETYTYRP